MGARGWIALVVAAPWVVWAVVRTLGLDVAWPVIPYIAFTPFVALTSPLPVVLALLLRRRVVAVVAAVAAVALAVAVVPRALGTPENAIPNGRSLTVMSSNLLGGGGDAEEVMRLVRRHDVHVLSLQEMTPRAVEALDAAGAAELLPGRVLEPRPGAAGTGIMSRYPITPVAADADAVPSQPAGDVELPGGRRLWVKAVHPYPPVDRPRSRAWKRVLRELPSAPPGEPLRVLAGDFNATLDHRAFRALLDRGWTDTADAVGEGLHPTWPVGRRGPLITIDHVLAGPGIGVRSFSVHDIPRSDHRATIARLMLSPR